MVFTGQLWKEGKFWIISVPAFEIVTQGRSKKNALHMIADAVKCHVDKSGFKVKASLLPRTHDKSARTDIDTFTLSSNDESEMIALFLKRQRQLNGLSIRELAKRLGYASPSAYAQYESGKHIPGLDKISRFISAMNPRAKLAVEVVAA